MKKGKFRLVIVVFSSRLFVFILPYCKKTYIDSRAYTHIAVREKEEKRSSEKLKQTKWEYGQATGLLSKSLKYLFLKQYFARKRGETDKFEELVKEIIEMKRKLVMKTDKTA